MYKSFFFLPEELSPEGWGKRIIGNNVPRQWMTFLRREILQIEEILKEPSVNLLKFSTVIPLDIETDSKRRMFNVFQPETPSSQEFTKEIDTEVYDEFWQELERFNRESYWACVTEVLSMLASVFTKSFL